MADIKYTQAERTNKTRTIGQAVQTAGAIHKGGLCVDAVGRRDYSTLITLPELNDLVEQIIWDSRYYG